MHEKFDIDTCIEEVMNSNLYNNNKIEPISRPSVVMSKSLYESLYQEPPEEQLLYAKFLEKNYSNAMNLLRTTTRNRTTTQTEELPMSRTFDPDSLRHARTYSSYDSVDLTEIFNREIQIANSVVGGRSRGYPAISVNAQENLTQRVCDNTRYEFWNDTHSNQPKETMSQQHYYLDLLEQTVESTPLYAITFHPEKGKPALYRTGTCYIAYFIATNRIIYNFLSSKTHSFFLNLFPTDGTRMTTIKLNAAHIKFSPKLINFMKNALWYKEFGGFPLQNVSEDTAVANAPDLLEGL